jgi:pentose-5-phosphate-3-epimerase
MRRKQGLNFILIADGGITRDNARAIWAAGADQLAAASAVFRHPGGINAGIEALKVGMDGC